MEPIRKEIDIAAPATVVWDHLATAEGLTRWMGVAATADARPDGELSWTHENGATMVGTFVELDPPHRLVFRYGWEDGRLGMPPASTTVEVTLTPLGDGRTRLALVHRGIPPASSGAHDDGWDHFLGVLAGLAAAEELSG